MFSVSFLQHIVEQVRLNRKDEMEQLSVKYCNANLIPTEGRQTQTEAQSRVAGDP